MLFACPLLPYLPQLYISESSAKKEGTNLVYDFHLLYSEFSYHTGTPTYLNILPVCLLRIPNWSIDMTDYLRQFLYPNYNFADLKDYGSYPVSRLGHIEYLYRT